MATIRRKQHDQRKHLRQSLPIAVGLAVIVLSSGTGAAGSGVRDGPLVDRELGRQIADAIDTARRGHGLRPLRWNRELAAAATVHSTDMAVDGYFGHSSPGGVAFSQRVRAAYAPTRATWNLGETLFYATPDATAGAVISAWLRTPHHRAIVLGTRWRDVGVSAVRIGGDADAFPGRRGVVVTADFGFRGPAG
jgi:uncharacterized protein YkwD